MKILGWIFVAWLIGSVLYSLRFVARGYSGMKSSGDPLGLANRWRLRMVVIQVIKAAIALLVITLLLK